MITPVANQGVLDSPMISLLRRNHGLEHATIHLLSKQFPRQALAGYSNMGGFWLIGNVPTEMVQSAVEEALQRMRNGEKELAVHPGCGTNYLTTGVLAGLAGGLAMIGVGRKRRDIFERLPLALTLATLGVIIAQPLGKILQERITTDGNPGVLHVIEIMCYEQGRMVLHHIRTRG